MPRRRLGAHPRLLGFERLDALFERAARIASDVGPPYNITACGPDSYAVRLAVPGFDAEHLEITVEPGGLLVVRGRPARPEPGQTVLHQGIAAQAFVRSFVLDDGVDVIGAALENGMLTIDLKRVEQSPGPQRIEIARP